MFFMLLGVIKKKPWQTGWVKRTNLYIVSYVNLAHHCESKSRFGCYGKAIYYLCSFWYMGNYRFLIFTNLRRSRVNIKINHIHKKHKDSLEGILDRVLSAAELEFPKILVPRLPQNSSNVNIECAGKSKQLSSFCDQLFGALIYLQFVILIFICFSLIM